MGGDLAAPAQGRASTAEPVEAARNVRRHMAVAPRGAQGRPGKAGVRTTRTATSAARDGRDASRTRHGRKGATAAATSGRDDHLQGRPRRAPKPRGFDPNSPFAALGSLKAATGQAQPGLTGAPWPRQTTADDRRRHAAPRQVVIVRPFRQVAHAGRRNGHGGKVRVNRVRVDKPSQTVRAGDVLTIAVAWRVAGAEGSGAGPSAAGPPAAARAAL